MVSWKKNVTQCDVLIACGFALFTLSNALFCGAQNGWSPHPDLERVSSMLKSETFDPMMVLFHPDTKSLMLNGQKGSNSQTLKVVFN